MDPCGAAGAACCRRKGPHITFERRLALVEAAGGVRGHAGRRFTLGGRDKIQVTSYPESYRGNYGNWGWGGRGYYGNQVYSSTDVRQYTEGTLAVDLYDVSDRKPVWHATAVRKITKTVRENPGEAVREILGNMFAAFPPS